MQKLAGKKVLITGGNSGIGLATAKLFKEQGARLIITGRDDSTLQQAQQTLGGDVLAVKSDTGNMSDIDHLMQQAEKHFGKIDVLFANAASGNPAPFAFVTEEQFDQMTTICFKGVFFMIQKALPLLSYGSSVIINTSITNQLAAPNFSVYAACKAAQRSLVRTLGAELIEAGIRVNAVSPGPVDTPGFGRWDVPREVVEAARAEFIRKSPLKRFAEPEEIAKAALFLASEDSSYFVGAELVADGGLSHIL